MVYPQHNAVTGLKSQRKHCQKISIKDVVRIWMRDVVMVPEVSSLLIPNRSNVVRRPAGPISRDHRYCKVSFTFKADVSPAAKASGVPAMVKFVGTERTGQGEARASDLFPGCLFISIVDQVGEGGGIDTFHPLIKGMRELEAPAAKTVFSNQGDSSITSTECSGVSRGLPGKAIAWLRTYILECNDGATCVRVLRIGMPERLAVLGRQRVP